MWNDLAYQDAQAAAKAKESADAAARTRLLSEIHSLQVNLKSQHDIAEQVSFVCAILNTVSIASIGSTQGGSQ